MKKQLNLSYGAIQGAYWMYFGTIMSFASVFLLGKNYTNSEIGIIMASASILAVFLQPMMGDAADRLRKGSVIELSGVITVGLLLATVSLFLFNSKTLILSVIFIFMGAWHATLQPLLNSMAFYLSKSGYSVNFGIARGAGSVSYSVFCAVLGVLVAAYGVDVIPAAGSIVLVLLLIFLLITGRLYRKAIQDRTVEFEIAKAKRREGAIGMKAFLARNKMFLLFTVGIVLVFFQNSVFNTYMMQIITAVGGDSTQMGRLFSYMALLELPGLMFFSRIRKKFSCQVLLIVASVAFTCKVGLTLIAPSVSFIYVAFLFQLISFPLFLSSSVHLVDEVMEKGEAVKGQSFITGMITLSSVFASLLGGILLDYKGASLLLQISTALAVIGTLIVAATVVRIKPKHD
jgi:PPP family 3-phenylpropionic acid transporter